MSAATTVEAEVINTNMPWSDYLELKRMNASTLVAGCKSMLRLKRCIEGGYPEETNAMRIGTGLHALLLEPEQFCNRFCVMPDYHLLIENETRDGTRTESKATNFYKQKRDSFAALNPGRIVIGNEQYGMVLKCLKAIHAKPRMSELVHQSQKEVSILSEIDGIPFKSRLDLLSPGIICDVKSTTNAEKHAFGRIFFNLRYDFKLAIYREAVRQHSGKTPAVFVIVQEIDGDFDNALVPIPDAVLDNAFGKVRAVLGDYMVCKATGRWPGVDNGKEEYPLEVPAWASGDDELNYGDAA